MCNDLTCAEVCDVSEVSDVSEVAELADVIDVLDVILWKMIQAVSKTQWFSYKIVTSKAISFKFAECDTDK